MFTRNVALLSVLATVASVATASHNITFEARDSHVVDVLSERGWTDVSFGLMLERDLPPSEQLGERGHLATRDLGSETTHVRFDERGQLMLPAHVASLVKRGGHVDVDVQVHQVDKRATKSKAKAKKANKKKRIVRKSRSTKKTAPKKKQANKAVTASASSLISSTVKAAGKAFAAKITWYTGRDLLGPSCVTHSKWAPTDKSMIAAVTINWASKPKCGSYLQLRPKNGKKAIIVRLVDSCAGCAAGTAHVDLTIAAFSKLYDLDVGLVNGIQVQIIGDPVKSYTKAAVAMYGPKVL